MCVYWYSTEHFRSCAIIKFKGRNLDALRVSFKINLSWESR